MVGAFQMSPNAVYDDQVRNRKFHFVVGWAQDSWVQVSNLFISIREFYTEKNIQHCPPLFFILQELLSLRLPTQI